MPLFPIRPLHFINNRGFTHSIPQPVCRAPSNGTVQSHHAASESNHPAANGDSSSHLLYRSYYRLAHFWALLQWHSRPPPPFGANPPILQGDAVDAEAIGLYFPDQAFIKHAISAARHWFWGQLSGTVQIEPKAFKRCHGEATPAASSWWNWSPFETNSYLKPFR